MSVRIRRGGIGDASVLAALHAPVFTDAWPAEAFASLLARDGVSVFLGARDAGSAEGFVLIRVAAGEAEVLTFCVADAARRCGLGRALLRQAFDTAAAAHASEMFLEVGEANVAALALYRREGFRDVGRRRAYYRHGDEGADALVMRKVLNAESPQSR